LFVRKKLGSMRALDGYTRQTTRARMKNWAAAVTTDIFSIGATPSC